MGYWRRPLHMSHNQFFLECMDKLIAHEGFASEVPNDKGGQTYAGISRVFNPDWPGWAIIDSKPVDVDQTDLWSHVLEFYWQKFKYWQLDKLQASDLVSYMFDTGVLFGGKRMVQATQGSLNMLVASEGRKIPCDGLMGPKTLNRLEDLVPPERDAVLAQLISWRVTHHVNVVHREPNQRKFLVGWLARAARY